MDGLLLICQVRNIGGYDWIFTLSFSNCRVEGVCLVAFSKNDIEGKKKQGDIGTKIKLGSSS